MNATEAEEFALSNMPIVKAMVIAHVERKIRAAAEKGQFSTTASLKKVPYIFSLTNALVEYFGSYGYEINVRDGETVQVRISWANA